MHMESRPSSRDTFHGLGRLVAAALKITKARVRRPLQRVSGKKK
jgi:hypothetical protein